MARGRVNVTVKADGSQAARAIERVQDDIDELLAQIPACEDSVTGTVDRSTQEVNADGNQSVASD